MMVQKVYSSAGVPWIYRLNSEACETVYRKIYNFFFSILSTQRSISLILGVQETNYNSIRPNGILMFSSCYSCYKYQEIFCMTLFRN